MALKTPFKKERIMKSQYRVLVLALFFIITTACAGPTPTSTAEWQTMLMRVQASGFAIPLPGSSKCYLTRIVARCCKRSPPSVPHKAASDETYVELKQMARPVYTGRAIYFSREGPGSPVRKAAFSCTRKLSTNFRIL